MAVGGLAGDGQGATTRSWNRFSRDLKVHDDVLGLFGLHRRDESFHNKARVVDLEVQENSFNKSRSRSSFTAQHFWQNWMLAKRNTAINNVI